MADYAQVHLAGLALPLTASTDNALLRDADPALFWFTQWCRGVIEVHFGPRWNAEVTNLGQAALVGKIVSATLPYDPVPYWQQASYPLPLLAVYRTGSKFNDATATWIRRVGIWELDYILPPLSPSQFERLSPIRTGIEAAIYDRINHDADPFVLDGQRLADLMQTESIKLLDSDASHAWLQVAERTPGTQTEQTLFQILHMRFEVAERRLPDTYPAITGVDTTVVNEQGTEIAAIQSDLEWGS